VLGNGLTTYAQADGAGITILGANANITYFSTGDKIVVNKNFEAQGNIVVQSITANVWTGLYTSNVIEGTNQYFTNVRVLQAANPRLTTANVTELTNQYFTNVRVLQAVTPTQTTANTVELTNLYFTNARAVAAMTSSIVSMQELTVAGNVNIGTGASGGNITGVYSITADRVYANVIGSITGNIVGTVSNFTTTDLREGANLYFTNARVYSNVTALLTNYGGTVAFSNVSNLTVASSGRINYANATSVVKVYQYYNPATNSLDTIFL
jgi:hypothetical protein